MDGHEVLVSLLGKFDATDLVYYFRKLRIHLDLDEANRLVAK